MAAFLLASYPHFPSSHILKSFPPEHQCARLHGHNYVVELVLQSETVNKHGFVVDYLALRPFKEYIDNNLDHRHLNDVLPFPTSAENIACHLYQWAKERWPQIVAVRVSETPKTWAEYREV